MSAIADLCGDVSAVAATDPQASATYAAVGDDERSRDPRVAAIAYRKALALDPTNARARAALDELCKSEVGGSSALLAAIARFHAGDLAAAGEALERIVAAGGDEATGAHFFLGLIALAYHESAAKDELAAAARDPLYATLVPALQRIARRQGQVELVVLVAPELDTNPELLPDTPPDGAATGPAAEDGDLLLAGTATARPTRWLVVREGLSFRKQRRLSALDYLGDDAQVEVTIPLGADRVAVRYDLDYDRIGGAGFLFANRGTVTYRHELENAALIAEYAARHRDYLGPNEANFTGWVHAGDAGAILRLRTSIDLDVRATIWRELTVDPTFADLAGGATATLRFRPADGMRLSGTATGWYASYDAAEPDGTERHDLHGAFATDAEFDLSDHVIAIAGTSVEVNHSTVPDFHYWKFVVRCGIAIALGAR